MASTQNDYRFEHLGGGEVTAPQLDYLLVFGVAGQLQLTGSGSAWTVGPAQFLALVPGAGLSLRVPPDGAGYLFEFGAEFFSTDALNKCLLLNHALFRQTPPGTVALSPGRWEEVTLLLRLLAQEAAAAAANDEVVRSLARVLLLKLADYAGAGAAAADANHELYLRFQNMLSKHYHQLHGTGAYAEALGVSARRLNHAVRATAGKSSCDFVSERVVAEAKHMLMHTPLSVKEVAFALGFADQYYFSRYFKKHTRQSPEHYRRAQAPKSI